MFIQTRNVSLGTVLLQVETKILIFCWPFGPEINIYQLKISDIHGLYMNSYDQWSKLNQMRCKTVRKGPTNPLRSTSVMVRRLIPIVCSHHSCCSCQIVYVKLLSTVKDIH